MNESDSYIFSIPGEQKRVETDENLMFLNQYYLNFDEELGRTTTSSGIYSPTTGFFNESKFYKNWYTSRAVNRQKLAFIRKYRPSFELPVVDFDKSEVSCGD